MRDYVFGAWRDVTIKRDGSVLVDGELAGHVAGEPRRWQWISPGGVDGSRGVLFTKRDAASACAWAHVKRSATDRAGGRRVVSCDVCKEVLDTVEDANGKPARWWADKLLREHIDEHQD